MDIERVVETRGLSEATTSGLGGDHVLDDPELAPGLMKLLYTSLTQTRDRLNEAQQKNKDLSRERDALLKANEDRLKEDRKIIKREPKREPNHLPDHRSSSSTEGFQASRLSEDGVLILRKEIRALKEQVKTANSEVVKVRMENDKLKEKTTMENTKLKQEIEKLRSAAAVETRRMEKLENMNSRLTAENSSLKTNVTRLRERWRSLQENFSQIAEEDLVGAAKPKAALDSNQGMKRKAGEALDPRVSQLRRIDMDNSSPIHDKLLQQAFNASHPQSFMVEGDTLWALLIDQLRCDECSRRRSNLPCTSSSGAARCDGCKTAKTKCSIAIFLRYRYFSRQSGMNLVQSRTYFERHIDQKLKERYSLSPEAWSRYVAAVEKLEASRPSSSSASKHMPRSMSIEI